MAVVTIAHKPELNKDLAQEIFRAHFEPRYKVETLKRQLGLRDFMLVRNPFLGVTVGLQQTPNETKFVFTGLAPRWWARVLSAGMLIYLFLNGPTNEVKKFIESAPEFK